MFRRATCIGLVSILAPQVLIRNLNSMANTIGGQIEEELTTTHTKIVRCECLCHADFFLILILTNNSHTVDIWVKGLHGYGSLHKADTLNSKFNSIIV